jgi:hypothetical protein
MAGLLVAFGCFLLAVALALLIDGSYYGMVIAWVLGTWGAMLVAWGLLAGWHRSLVACIVASAFALASVLVALLYNPDKTWELAILCALGSGLAFMLGVFQIRHLVRQRRPSGES